MPFVIQDLQFFIPLNVLEREIQGGKSASTIFANDTTGFSTLKGSKGETEKNLFSLFPLPPCSPALVFIFCILLNFVFAQTTDNAIALASSHPSFAGGLNDRPGWTATAYNTKNYYGIWRVQFYDADGNSLGWADVNLEKQKVYTWETHFDLSDGQYAEAEEALLNFARHDQTVIDMIGNIDESNGIWIGFDAWRELWIVSVDRWPNSVELNIRSRSTNSHSLENLYLEKVLVQDIMSYEDWQSASSSQAVEIAFQTPEIAAAVRGKDWSTYAERLEGNIWKIHFMSGDQQIAEADVNVDDNSILGFSVQ